MKRTKRKQRLLILCGVAVAVLLLFVGGYLLWKSQSGQESFEISTLEQAVEEYELEHLSIEGITGYYYHPSSGEPVPLLVFLHGQGGQKEEFLPEFETYAQLGYACLAIDLAGHGERAQAEPLTALEATVQTSEDLERVLSHLNGEFSGLVLYGISQGGAVAYHYAAFKSHTPDALVVASTSPDFVDNYDETVIINGNGEAGEEGQDTAEFIEANNPIANWEKLSDIVIFSGITEHDSVVSVLGTQELERLFAENRVETATFLYYSGSSHDLPEAFFLRVQSFLANFYK